MFTLSCPRGSFTLHKDFTRPAVFLVGGIGITPMRSILHSLGVSDDIKTVEFGDYKLGGGTGNDRQS
jgi:ferredoxin-NADP reductase